MAVVELEVSIPQELSAIKLHQYQKYLSVAKGVDEGDKNNEFLNLKALEIFCGLSLKDSYNLPVSMFESVLKQLSDCFGEKTDLVQRFKMTGADGVTAEFGFIPNLDKRHCFFLSFRDKIVKIYDELFTGTGGEDREYSLEAGFGRKWGWYQSIYGLAGGDVLKLDSVTEIPLHKCLMWLAFEKEKNEIEAKMIKQSYNKN